MQPEYVLPKHLHQQTGHPPAYSQAHAVKARGGKVPPHMIFHSDGGGQYYDKAFLQYTAKHHMRNSMCEFAYQNGKAERLNGTIKNNYLIHFNINSLRELHKSVDRAVTLYNHQRPHKALKYQTPAAYENSSVILQQQTVPLNPVAAPTFIQQLRDQ
jgi:transposase InsO family protein